MKRLLILLYFNFSICTIAFGTTWYVTTNGNGNGRSPYTPARDLALIMQNAQYGDSILVASGNYTSSHSRANYSYAFKLKSGVKIFGGYHPGTYFNPSLRNWEMYGSVLDGSTSFIIRNHTVVIHNADENTLLDGFYITGGVANSFYPDYLEHSTYPAGHLVNRIKSHSGGGVYVANTSVVLRNLKVYKNCADINGGGIYTENSICLLDNVSVYENGAGVNGGGICLKKSLVSIVNSEIMGNDAFFGGGVYFMYESTTIENDGRLIQPQISNTQIHRNSSLHKGGGVYFAAATTTFVNTQIYYNGQSNILGRGIYAAVADACHTCSEPIDLTSGIWTSDGVCRELETGGVIIHSNF